VLAYQSDGNLVVYHDGQPAWASMVFAAPGTCQFQDDGNLVCYDASGRPYWHSGTHGHVGARLALQDDGNVVIYAADGTPVWATMTILSPREVEHARFAIYGNFLANGIEPWGFLSPLWWTRDRPRWTRFVQAYTAAGYRHLPFALYGQYGNSGWFELRDPDLAVAVVRAHLDAGIMPILMAITDDIDRPNAPEAWERVRPAIEAIVRSVGAQALEFCCGWEINQVYAFNEQHFLSSGDDLIHLCHTLRRTTGKAPWLHLQPNWWAPHYEGRDEDRWWRDVGDRCAGLLFQIAPDSSLDLTRPRDGREADGLYLALRLPRGSDGAEGIAGRLASTGHRFVLFEHSRDPERWKRVEAIVRPDRRVVGIC
jgi:hypothetical protein